VEIRSIKKIKVIILASNVNEASGSKVELYKKDKQNNPKA
jgi:hypothetical protein